MIVGFHHAQITIPKNQELAARRFYCELLQLNEIPKPASLEGRGGFWVQIGAQALHIGTEDGVDRSKTKAHLAYEVRDLDKIRSLLDQHAVEILESVPITGYVRFECRDPFGNRVEFIQRLFNEDV
ncbi:glyoxalase [Paenibacillus selenitireducens]|uniref:Glyoxalase n=1 Tax=Paenibacillus selenitireducens TaxID=1324314 RepID=A0A1T2X1K8_9BACL|nr:VOC family protein [Paenibacillus selenitireducens]OPA73778.1 glyoxalase [Paenibacillus selenitireducens]